MRITQWLSCSSRENRNQKRNAVWVSTKDCWFIPIGNIKKLAPNILNKEKYVLYYEHLQLYLRLGLKLKKINPVLEFNQSQWLKPYIEFNTKKL